ncbi:MULTISPECIES: DUF192 domain-containing protein [Nitrosomonas]|uniref:DUF192 domain-containing protein n=1 Tax=Nitrosomonas TaxID=914 RepID=UPI00079CC636|nr:MULTISPECIES: DUF192 domain-containing protein [Nitrosomonas]KXK43222.1 MAG: hypothetical protein UZ02_AOB001001317 [Nitrosomonas europaea]MBV6388598.1 hypothetical protein [Nitrosomonas europaea]
MLRSCLAVLLMVSSLSNTAEAEDQSLPVVKLSILDHVITVELADTTAARTTGLMYRTYLPEDSGMLFVFPVAGIHCMWMKDTILPLSVAFLDETGKILNLAGMIPETLTPHCSASAARYALEMDAAWFEARKIKAGDRVMQLPDTGR